MCPWCQETCPKCLDRKVSAGTISKRDIGSSIIKNLGTIITNASGEVPVEDERFKDAVYNLRLLANKLMRGEV